MTTEKTPAFRLGALRYLNALPLVDGLDRRDDVSITYEIPSLLARDLREGRFDLALVPQVEATRDDAYRIVHGPCVACDGAVDSILLFSTKRFADIRKVGVDLSSNTSVELLSVLFHLRGLAVPELVAVPPRLDPLRAESPDLDAVLLIGDRALAEDHGEFPRFDLGAIWKEETGLPFVFAVWIGREETPPEAIDWVRQTLAENLPRRPELAEAFWREFPEVLDPEGARRYLTETIRYQLGPREEEALARFHTLRAEIGRATPGWRPRFFEEPA
ncbi:MAG: menaquinone biosynthesis protein [Planctomycetota bacterium]